MFAVKGTFLDAPIPGELRIRETTALVNNGRLVRFLESGEALPDNVKLDDYSGQLILPGFSDLHLHASQYRYCGTAMDVELMQWLEQYAFPEEARFADVDFARETYPFFVRDLLAGPATRICAFATIHTDATLELMRQLEKAGIRGYVGKLNMNRNSPAYYCEASTAKGIRETERWLNACATEGFRNMHPMLTPRFTPSVTDDYMQALGRLAAERSLPMQSHLSENTDEIAWVSNLCPDTDYYYQTYSRYGLFGGSCPTVMAHCIYSSEEENMQIRQNHVFIAHCPTSNENVIAGICPAAHYLRNGYAIGLGSDVAGGHTLNLLSVMSAAVMVSKLRWKYVDKAEKPLSILEAFYMATTGGGAFFGKVGLFEEGYEFDAVVPDETALNNTRPFTPAERLERLAYRGSGHMNAKYIAGEKLY